MAKMITRTMKLTEADVLAINTATEQTEVVKLEFGKVFKNEKQILKAAEKLVPSDLKVVSVKAFDVKERRLGITEEQFIEYAIEMPPLAKKEN
mgnify:CR=1 FL=1